MIAKPKNELRLDKIRIDGGTQLRDGIASMSPMALFADFTYLGFGDEATDIYSRITRRCFEFRSVPIADWHAEHGLILHTLIDNQNDTTYRKQCASWEYALSTPRAPRLTEQQLEALVAAELMKTCASVRRQVRTSAGRIDILTEHAVYEVEIQLTRQKIFEAVGQVLAYRQALNPLLRAVIVGRPAHRTTGLLKAVRELGVEVWQWGL